MIEYKWPMTLTMVQFAFVSLFSFIYSRLTRGAIKRPNSRILQATMPLGLFQIVGHCFSSMALTYVSVSFSHTVKALSPLFTVLVYMLFYSISYSRSVYISLAILTTGVVLVCSTNFHFHFLGFLCSLGATVVFVL
jgi:solute carrier family 35 protein E1